MPTLQAKLAGACAADVAEILELCVQFPAGLVRLLLTALQTGIPDDLIGNLSLVHPTRPAPRHLNRRPEGVVRVVFPASRSVTLALCSPDARNVLCVRETEILVEQQPPAGGLSL